MITFYCDLEFEKISRVLVTCYCYNKFHKNKNKCNVNNYNKIDV